MRINQCYLTGNPIRYDNEPIALAQEPDDIIQHETDLEQDFEIDPDILEAGEIPLEIKYFSKSDLQKYAQKNPDHQNIVRLAGVPKWKAVNESNVPIASLHDL